MEAKRIEKFKRSSLYNLSNITYKYLKKKMEYSDNDRIIINEEFDYESYKESIRSSLSEFSFCFNSLVAINSDETRTLSIKKAKLKEYVDEILDDEKLLESFTIYKLQQFINRVARNAMENNYKNYETISKRDKYIVYKDIAIDMSNMIGFVDDNKIIEYLYKEFNLKRIKPNEYTKVKELDDVKENDENVNELNKFLFKVGAYIDENDHAVKYHPFSDDKSVMECLREGCVAERTPKRKKAKEYKLFKEDEDISLND